MDGRNAENNLVEEMNNIPEWMQLEGSSVKVGLIRNALKIGSMAVDEGGRCIGGMTQELKEFFYLLMEYSKMVEDEIMDISGSLLEKKKERKEAS